MQGAVTITEASRADKPLIAHLLQLCLGEFSVFDSSLISSNGRFNYPWLERYWTDADRLPFVICNNHTVAGFVLVRRDTHVAREWDFSIAEFFVLPELRGQHIGQAAASLLLSRHPGLWEIAYDLRNRNARRFWTFVARSIDSSAQPTPAGPIRERLLVRSFASPTTESSIDSAACVHKP